MAVNKRPPGTVTPKSVRRPVAPPSVRRPIPKNFPKKEGEGEAGQMPQPKAPAPDSMRQEKTVKMTPPPPTPMRHGPPKEEPGETPKENPEANKMASFSPQPEGGSSSGEGAPPHADSGIIAEKEEKRRKKGMFIPILMGILILALIGGNVGVYMMKNQVEQELAETELTLTKREDYIQRLEKELEKIRKERQILEGKNAEQSDLLDQRRKQLIARESKINGLLAELRSKDAKISDLQKSKEELEALKEERKKFIEDLDNLSKSNELLKAENQSLKRQLQDALARLDKAGASEEDPEEFVRMSVPDITVTGIYLKRGREEETTKRKKIERLKITFTIDKNKKIPAGSKDIHFRIMDPDGKVLGVEGSVTDEESGRQLDYTFVNSVDYPLSGLESKYWPVDGKLNKGSYKVELYNKGFKIGQARFTLE